MLWIWLAVIGVAFAMEIATQLQLVSIWAAVGGIAALLSFLFGADVTLQVIIFFAVTFVLLALTRPFVHKLTKKVKPTPTNADRNIGKVAKVTKIIDADEGMLRVSINGEDWSAVTEDNILPEIGSGVIIKEIKGVKLVVTAK